MTEVNKVLRSYLILGILFLLSPASLLPISAVEISSNNASGNNLNNSETLPFLGFGGTFGRWENGVIPITYNHAGAPADRSIDEMESLLLSSFTILEEIADVRFDYEGLTNSDYTDEIDGVVVIAWGQLEEGVAGRAGPDFGDYTASDYDRLGHWPYLDGSVRLNTLSTQVDQSVVLHELIHLLGLGHSENPISIMNRNLIFFDLPQDDDIQALQKLYGPPDKFVRPTLEIALIDSATSGIEPDPSNSGFYFRLDGADLNDINPIDTVDESLNNDDDVFLRVGFMNATIGDELIAYVTDPVGNSTVPNPSRNPAEITFVSGAQYVFVGTAGELRSLPGEWEITLGVNGREFTTVTLLVSGDTLEYNRTPVVSLRSEFDGLQNFSLTLDIADPEGDSITTTWYVPSVVQQNVNDGNRLVVDLDASQPQVVQVFGYVVDDVFRQWEGKNSGSQPGQGFGALESRFLVVPAEVGIPTFFVDEQLLHIPDLEIEGVYYSLNFKLTALADTSFKFLELDQVPESAALGYSSLDLVTGELLLSKLKIVEGTQIGEIDDVRFSLVSGSNPVRIRLEQ